MHPFGITNKKIIAIWTPWSKMVLSICRTICHNFQFNSSIEGSITKCLFDTAPNASNSKDVDVLKLRLTQFDIECFMMLINVISKGWFK